jgi:hypothetical protein
MVAPARPRPCTRPERDHLSARFPCDRVRNPVQAQRKPVRARRDRGVTDPDYRVSPDPAPGPDISTAVSYTVTAALAIK